MLREYVDRGSRLTEDLRARLQARDVEGLEAATAGELLVAVSNAKAAVDKVGDELDRFLARSKVKEEQAKK